MNRFPAGPTQLADGRFLRRVPYLGPVPPGQVAATWRGRVEVHDGVKDHRPARWQIRWPKLTASNDVVVTARAASPTRQPNPMISP